MKSELTDISIVLDRSGSMSTVKTDTIGGFNTFLADQQAAPGQATLTLVQFDHEYEVVHDAKPIGDVPKLDNTTFCPRGSTALIDAIGRTILNTGDRLAKMPEADRPGKVVFVILTDGDENCSREYTPEKVLQMISHQRDAYQWQFIFLGANQDAIKAGSSIGIHAANSMSYAANAVGTRSAFVAASGNVTSYRGTGKSADLNWTADQRKEQKAAGATH